VPICILNYNRQTASEFIYVSQFTQPEPAAVSLFVGLDLLCRKHHSVKRYIVLANTSRAKNGSYRLTFHFTITQTEGVFEQKAEKCIWTRDELTVLGRNII